MSATEKELDDELTRTICDAINEAYTRQIKESNRGFIDSESYSVGFMDGLMFLNRRVLQLVKEERFPQVKK